MCSTSDCYGISGIADQGASRVCNNVAPGVHIVLAGLALDGVWLRHVDEGVVGLKTVAAGGHGGMLIFEEFGKKNADL